MSHWFLPSHRGLAAGLVMSGPGFGIILSGFVVPRLVPTFGLPEDARAAAILREVIPGRTLVPVPARDLVQGLGAIHCLTQQEPRLAAE